MGICIGTIAMPCIFKELEGEFWGKLWTLTTQHGFLIWPWHNKYIFLHYTHPPTKSFSYVAPSIMTIVLVQGGVMLL